MEINNKAKSADKINSIMQIIKEHNKNKYFKECKFIWKNYVPQTGQSEVLQGELLREIEKLRYEAQYNGNINWNEDFSYFCDFIKEKLCEQTIYDDDEKRRIELILSYLKDCGDYAMHYIDGEISDDEVEVEKIAYIQDDLYDIIADTIGQLQAKHPAPIPFEKNINIKS